MTTRRLCLKVTLVNVYIDMSIQWHSQIWYDEDREKSYEAIRYDEVTFFEQIFMPLT